MKADSYHLNSPTMITEHYLKSSVLFSPQEQRSGKAAERGWCCWRGVLREQEQFPAPGQSHHIG